MKKSTLITTIAMIVVVVVALSTATYAWFSASEVAVATVDMSTTASSDWALVQGVKQGSNISFAGASSDQISLTNSMNGLYSPTAAITTRVTQVLQATESNRATFYSAKKIGPLVKQDGEMKPIDPYYIRVINTKNTDKHLILSVVVAIEKDNTTSYYAAAATKFYVDDGTNSYTSGYKYNAGSTSSGGDITSGTPTGNETMTNSGVVLNTESGSAGRFEYTNPVLSTFFKTVPSTPSPTETKMGLVATNQYFSYDIDLGTYAAATAKNLVIYAWIDGWDADASAANANFSVKFAFYTKEAAGAGAGA